MTNVYGSAKNIPSILLLLRHLTIDRANNRSFPISSQLNRSEVPIILPESRALKNLSPHNLLTPRAEIVLQSPHKYMLFHRNSLKYSYDQRGKLDSN